MIPDSSNPPSQVTRRQAIKRAAGVAGLAALSQLPGGGTLAKGQAPSLPQGISAIPQGLRIATCQFPVSGNPTENGKYVRDFMAKAAEKGAYCSTAKTVIVGRCQWGV